MRNMEASGKERRHKKLTAKCEGPYNIVNVLKLGAYQLRELEARYSIIYGTLSIYVNSTNED